MSEIYLNNSGKGNIKIYRKSDTSTPDTNKSADVDLEQTEIYVNNQRRGNVTVYNKSNDESTPNTNKPVDVYLEQTDAETYLRRDKLLAEIDTEAKRQVARANLGIADTAALNWGNINGEISDQSDLVHLFENSSEYNSSLPSSAYMQETVGNIEKGTTVADLTGTPVSILLDRLLFK